MYILKFMERTGRIIIGNWKMYKASQEAATYIAALYPLVEKVDVHVYLAVPYTSIASAALEAKPTNIVVGAQNMHEASSGAFTGEIAALMLKEAGAAFVLLGHSERRLFFGEDDERIVVEDEAAPKKDLPTIIF